MDAQPAQRYLGPIKLSPGITPREVILFLFVIAIMQVMVGLTSLLQPFIYSEILHLPAKEFGRVNGLLTAVQSAMVMIFISIAGALADRVGRKAMLLFAIAGFSICAVLYPLVTSVMTLLIVRMLFGIAQNGHTAGAPIRMLDYPDNLSRGKFMALVMITLNLTSIVLVGQTGSHLPAWLHTAGLTTATAGRVTFWIVAGMGVVTLVIAALFLQPDRRAPREGSRGSLHDFFGGFVAVYRHALERPGFALLMITGFVIRTDVTMIQSFIALWIVKAGQSEGLNTLQALKIVGNVTSVQLACMLVVPPLFSMLVDRFNRVLMYGLSMGCAGLAFMSTIYVHSVLTWGIYASVIAIGIAEAAQTLSQQSLFGQEAPPALRGTAYGVSAFTGQVSVVIIAAVSGFLFDKVGYTSPFVLVGVLHLVFLAISVAFMAITRGRTRAAQT